MIKNRYDIIVIGGGLGGLTAANRLARAGHQVLLAEQHSQLGGLATFFQRRDHVFDVALHGFPVGMKKSFRKYWGKDFADRVTQVKSIRFHNPQYRLESTFDTSDFTAKLTGHFRIPAATVQAFFAAIANMNYFDQNGETTRDFFQRFFPGRTDVWRFLMEPITYANGSTLDEPAISYGIVFGNFMSEGVYTFTGGTDLMLNMMMAELRRNGVDVETNLRADRVIIENRKVKAVVLNGQAVACNAAIGNGSLPRIIHELAGDEHFDQDFLADTNAVRLSTSSCQVYIGIKDGEKLPFIGDLIFTSTWPEFDPDALLSTAITSRTYSVYYPEIRPGTRKYSIVASMNARHQDWDALDRQQYRAAKQAMIENTLDALTEYLPDIRSLVDYTEAATPRTFARYTGHLLGATFGTKFEGLRPSMELGKQVGGLFHTGSVGIIMSGWLGAANYGVITANEADKYVSAGRP
ncbi:MAG: NAD(P)-binding protein [Lentisphaeria bacterium]|nr:NAD(P)-binding protein [Lentisphaeria bacterium]